MKSLVCLLGLLTFSVLSLDAGTQAVPATGQASWYGEDHRGKPMANGKPFNPDRLTAASWFYPLGTRVRVTLRDDVSTPPSSVVVTITDRGPNKRLVRNGRIIDLSRAAFKSLASPDLGLIPVEVQPIP